jgi:uncharacterized protein
MTEPNSPDFNSAPPPITPEYATPGTTGNMYLGPVPDQDARTMGMLCHLLGIFTGFIGPLIIWLIKKDSSPFVDDQGKEALNFQIIALIATFCCLLGFCFAPLLIAAVQVTRIVFCIIATVQANQGVAYRYPLPFRLIR